MENKNKNNTEKAYLNEKLNEAWKIVKDGLKEGNLEAYQEAIGELSDHINDHPELKESIKEAYISTIRERAKNLMDQPDKLREMLLKASVEIVKYTRKNTSKALKEISATNALSNNPFVGALDNLDVPDGPTPSKEADEASMAKQVPETDEVVENIPNSDSATESSSVNPSDIDDEIEGQIEDFFELKSEEERSSFLDELNKIASETDPYPDFEDLSQEDRERLRQEVLDGIEARLEELDKKGTENSSAEANDDADVKSDSKEVIVSDLRKVIELLNEALKKDSKEAMQEVLVSLENFAQNEANSLVSKSTSGFDKIVEYYGDIDGSKAKLKEIIGEIEGLLKEEKELDVKDEEVRVGKSEEPRKKSVDEGNIEPIDEKEEESLPVGQAGGENEENTELNDEPVVANAKAEEESADVPGDLADEVNKSTQVEADEPAEVEVDRELEETTEAHESISLQKLLLELSQNNLELNKKFREIFDILALDAKNNELLKSIQDDLENELLAKEIPAKLKEATKDDIKDGDKFDEAFYKLPYRKQKKALNDIKELLDDEEVKGMIEDAKQFMKDVTLESTEEIDLNPLEELEDEDENPFEDGEDEDDEEGSPLEEAKDESTEESSAEKDKDETKELKTVPESSHWGPAVEGQKEAESKAVGWEMGDLNIDHPIDDATLRSLHPRMAKFDPESAEVKAIKKTLEEAGLSKDKMEALKVYLANPVNFTSKEVLDLSEKGAIDLKNRAQEIELEIEELKSLIESKKSQLKAAGKQGDPEKAKELEGLYDQRLTLNKEGLYIKKALEYKEGKMSYKKPEELLVMINIFLSGEDADAEDIIKETEGAIRDADKANVGLGHSLANRISLGLFKPRLTSLLKTIGDDIEDLKGLETDDLIALSKLHNDQKGVNRWIENLGKTPEVTYGKILPKIIGYLEAAINAGGISYINSWSLKKTKNLVEKLRAATQSYNLEVAEKTKGDTGDKVLAYLDQKNKGNKAAETIAQKAFKRKLLKAGAGNLLGLGGAVGTTATGLFALGAGALAVGGAAASGGLFWKGRGTKSEKDKEIYKHAATGTLVASGLGAGVIGLTGLSAIPAVGIALGGSVIGKAAWHYRKKLASGTIKNAPKAAKIGWRATKVTTGVALASTLVGIPLAYFGRNFFFKK